MTLVRRHLALSLALALPAALLIVFVVNWVQSRERVVLLERTASGSKPPANETAAEHAGLVADFRKYAGVK